MTRDEYTAHLRHHGYSVAIERTKPANDVDDRHTHEFDACLLMLDGEYTLTFDDGPRTFRAGDMCEVPRGTPHAEKVGPTDIRYLVGKREAGAV